MGWLDGKEKIKRAKPLPGFYIRRCPPCEASKLPLPRPIRMAAQHLGAWLKPNDVCNTHRMTLDMPGNMVQTLSRRIK